MQIFTDMSFLIHLFFIDLEWISKLSKKKLFPLESGPQWGQNFNEVLFVHSKNTFVP